MTTQIALAFTFGVVFVVALLVLAIAFPKSMDRVGTRVVLIGDYGGERFSTGFDDPDRLEELPADYSGGIRTGRIDLIGPAVRNR